MITFIKKVWSWLKYSSVNADSISMTFRGIATLIVPIVLYVANIYKLNIDNGTVTAVVDSISTTIIVVGGFIGAAITVVGSLRKIWTSVNGTNEVIASFKR